ncbi:MAG: hypothetical protein A2X63_09610 [Ignavibacteria bacterium GWA2_35_8]|nr:MAG: hypothetical protein A2X63_09610 [Ignavibacteria bacterium GWA2_35_8]
MVVLLQGAGLPGGLVAAADCLLRHNDVLGDSSRGLGPRDHPPRRELGLPVGGGVLSLHRDEANLAAAGLVTHRDGERQGNEDDGNHENDNEHYDILIHFALLWAFLPGTIPDKTIKYSTKKCFCQAFFINI